MRTSRTMRRDGSRFTGQYAEDGKARRLAVRANAGHRCIRCGHPFETGKHGKGEWSPCDERCAHQTPIREQTNLGPFLITRMMKGFTAGDLVKRGSKVEAQWRILTVHHLDGNKGNDAWWNLLSLCQRCHLQIQGKVDPNVPWFLEHSPWFRPYVAGYYAKKYEDRDITRQEAEARMDELLAYEQRT